MVEVEDKLNFESNPEIKNKFGDEKILFSDKIIKKTIEMFTKSQERNFVVTDLGVYIFKGTEIKRRIKIEDLKGITISEISDQFILHCNQNEYDYLFIYPDKKKIAKVLESIYEFKTGKDLLFCKKHDKDLSKFVVTKIERTKNPYLFKIEQHELTSIKDYIEVDNHKSKKMENNEQNLDIYNTKRIISLLDELHELKSKLPYQSENKNEKLIAVIFQSPDQRINIPFVCNNTEQFFQLERKLYKIEQYNEFKDDRNYFICNGKKIEKLDTLLENNIKNGDKILLIPPDD